MRKDGKPEKQYNSKEKGQLIRTEVVNMMVNNNSKDLIVKHLMENHDFSEDRACFIYKTTKAELNAQYKQFMEEVAENNIQRLLALIEQTQRDGCYKECISAIDTINKMTGQYVHNLHIDQEPIITLNFNA